MDHLHFRGHRQLLSVRQQFVNGERLELRAARLDKRQVDEPGREARRAMHCRCCRQAVLAHGMCATCYILRRQDEEYFGGLREMVLERDGYRCRVCDRPGTGKRSITVHHRVPGESKLQLMISLCPGCHARVHRTKAVLAAMPPLLLVLWREQHPDGHEQTALDFRRAGAIPERVPLF